MTSTPLTIGLTKTIGAIRLSPNRVSFGVFNLHGTAILYIKEGKEVAIASGIPIYPNGNFALNRREDGKSVTEEYSLVSDTATTLVRIFEGFEE